VDRRLLIWVSHLSGGAPPAKVNDRACQTKPTTTSNSLVPGPFILPMAFVRGAEDRLARSPLVFPCVLRCCALVGLYTVPVYLNCVFFTGFVR